MTWEARIYHGLRPDDRAALFFKLHHAKAIFAAMTDAARAADDAPPAAA